MVEWAIEAGVLADESQPISVSGKYQKSTEKSVFRFTFHISSKEIVKNCRLNAPIQTSLFKIIEDSKWSSLQHEYNFQKYTISFLEQDLSDRHKILKILLSSRFASISRDPSLIALKFPSMVSL